MADPLVFARSLGRNLCERDDNMYSVSQFLAIPMVYVPKFFTRDDAHAELVCSFVATFGLPEIRRMPEAIVKTDTLMTTSLSPRSGFRTTSQIAIRSTT